MAEALSDAAPPRFEMRGIRKAFGATVAVDGVDLAVAAGEVCALVGENGAGKSTLMAILAGALRPDAGTMTLDGADYRPRSPLDARQAGVAMIYQELSLAPHLTVMENVALGVEPTRRGIVQWDRMRRMARDALAELGHTDIDPDAPVASLSVAGQQLVEIARALSIGCRVLVLDEPTSTLSRDDARRLFALIRRLKAQGHAVVYISHFIEEVKEVADRIVVLRDGRVAGSGAASSLSLDSIVRMMVGRSVDDLYPRSTRRRGEAILDVDAIEAGLPRAESSLDHARLPTPLKATLSPPKGRGDPELAEGSRGSVSFTLHRGEILGIAGLVGAGRTRLLRALFALEPVRRGRIRVGVYTQAATPADRWSQGMGLVSEDRKGEGLALGLGIGDNLTLSRLEGLGPGAIVLPSRQDAAARRWIERIGIRCAHPRQPALELSGGNQQKVAIARLLHHDVDVLVLDEPTRGIDVASKAQIYRLLDALVSEPTLPKAILMVSSYVPELLGLCDRVAVMRRGRLGPARPVADWDEHRLMMEATGAGEAA